MKNIPLVFLFALILNGCSSTQKPDPIGVISGPTPVEDIEFEFEKIEKSLEAEPIIIKTQTFAEMLEFSFEYPIFKDWEIKQIEKKSENEYVIFLDWPNNIQFEVAPQITIKKITGQEGPEFGKISEAKENDSGNFYEYIYLPNHYVDGYDPKGHWDGIHFYQKEPESGVLITLNIGSGDGFSREILAEKIIETFTFN